MPAPSPLYRAVALLARAALPFAALGLPRLRRMLRERREGRRRFAGFESTRPAGARVVLFHASSAGELRQLEPVLRRLRDRHPGWRMVVTWFSTSGAAVAQSFPADLSGALPWDTPWETGRMLDRLRPDLLVVGKADLWLELSWQAERRNIPVVLLAATIRPASSRLRWPTAAILRGGYSTLAAVGVVDRDEIPNLVVLGIDPARTTISGDPRHDSVLDRLALAPPEVADPTLIVAGSTWPADDVVLLTALAELRDTHPQARLLIVPHNPEPATHRRLAELAPLLGLTAPVTLAASVREDVLLIEPRVGQLALQYRLGGIAYVGGGFGSAGLHSVLEPAATGAPVIVGPRWRQNRDAVALHEAGGLLPLDQADHVEQLVAIWSHWLTDAAARQQAGANARRVVSEGAGAAERSVKLVERVLSLDR